MKHLNGRLISMRVLLTLIVLSVLTNFTMCIVHIELIKSTAKCRSEYLKSLRFMQRYIVNPVSSFLEEKEITLHQQVYF